MVSITDQDAKRLTNREKDILVLVRKGTHAKSIAHQLGISLQTVKNHLSNLYDKCNVPHWAQPMAWLAVNADRISQEIGDYTP